MADAWKPGEKRLEWFKAGGAAVTVLVAVIGVLFFGWRSLEQQYTSLEATHTQIKISQDALTNELAKSRDQSEAMRKTLQLEFEKPFRSIQADTFVSIIKQAQALASKTTWRAFGRAAKDAQDAIELLYGFDATSSGLVRFVQNRDVGRALDIFHFYTHSYHDIHEIPMSSGQSVKWDESRGVPYRQGFAHFLDLYCRPRMLLALRMLASCMQKSALTPAAWKEMHGEISPECSKSFYETRIKGFKPDPKDRVETVHNPKWEREPTSDFCETQSPRPKPSWD